MDSAAIHHGLRIVGREREQALLREQLSVMLSGRGSLVLIGGPAGIGKTSLIRDLLDSIAGHDVLVLAGGSYDLSTTPPYGPWIEAFEAVSTSLGESGAHTVPRFRSPRASEMTPLDHVEQTELFLAAISQTIPVVIILEDIHWADMASLDLLRYVARRAGNRHLLLIATYRSDELAAQSRLGSILPALVRESQPVRIDLRPLGRGAIEQMVQTRYDLPPHDWQRLADYLHALGSGNPLYMQEMMRSFEADGRLVADGDGFLLGELDSFSIPPLLQQTIRQRVSQLSEPTQEALALAAVIGQDVPIDHWSLACGFNDRSLVDIVEEAVAAHVLEEQPAGRGLRFSHALVRESMYQSLPLPLRRLRHLKVADVLSALPDANPYTVAYHFQQAGDVRAVEWFVRAGLRARATAAWFSAAQAFESAAVILRGKDTRVREYGWLSFEAGFLRRFSGEPQSLDLLDAAEQAGLEADDPLLVAFARYARGSRLSMRGVINHGLQDIARGIAEIDTLLQTQPVYGTEEHALDVIRSMLGESDTAVDDQPLPVAPESEQRTRVNQQRGVLINWLGMSGRYRECITNGEQFVAAFMEAFGDQYMYMSQCITGRRGLGHAYAAMGRPDDARREFRLAQTGYRAIRDYAILGEALWNELVSVVLPYAADRPAERSRLVDEASDTWDRCVGITIVTAGDGPPARLPVDMLEGRWREAVKMAKDHLTSPWVMLVQEGPVTIGTVARHQGDVTTAWECIHRLFPQGPATEPGDSYFMVAISGAVLAAELAMDAGDLQTAQQWIDMHQRWLEWNGAHTWRPDTALLRARLYHLSGEPLLATQHAEDSLQLASDPRQPLRLLAAQRMLGTIALQQGDIAGADAQLHASVELARACAAVFELALSHVALAEARILAGQLESAKVLLDDAESTLASLQAAPMLQQVAMLRAEIAAVSGSDSAVADQLTPREREVLRLVATGKSNREIANELFLSPRTIERHIANIYLKIDVHNKAEAVVYALTHNMI